MVQFDAISVLYAFSIFFLGLVIIAIIVQRQIQRLRMNSARREPNVNYKDLGRRRRNENMRKLEVVGMVRAGNVPKLTDCTTINEHYNAPYLHRMIAMDEVSHEIDAQMERISPKYKREPGETTLDYLLRLRQSFKHIPLPLIHRIAFLYESARFRMQPFDLEQRMELKSLLNQFVKIVGESSEVNVGQEEKKRRNKFGGSDGVRLLMGAAGMTPRGAAGADGHTGVWLGMSPFHRRRNSDVAFQQ